MASLRNTIIDLSKEDVSNPISTPPASLTVVPVLDSRLQKTDIRTQPLTKYDNFYTPKNDFFYNNSPYLRLDARRQEIRLIRVFPPKTYDQHIKSNPKWAPMDQAAGLPLQLSSTTVYKLKQQFPYLSNPLIACEIVDKVPLSSMVGCYFALSYCSGKPIETRPVIVDGVPFNTFAALELAIRLVLRYWNSTHPGKESELLLWVDQICINQYVFLFLCAGANAPRVIFSRHNSIPKPPPGIRAHNSQTHFMRTIGVMPRRDLCRLA